MKSYSSLKIVFSKALKDVYPSNELDRIFFLILQYKLGWKKIDYILNRDKLPNAEFEVKIYHQGWEFAEES